MSAALDFAIEQRMSESSHTTHSALRAYSKFLAVMTFLLVFAGSLVTSTGSGLAVPDWPLSYGMLFPPMVGGVLYEHGHRLLAASVGFFTVVMLVWVRFVESRQWVRNLSALALLAVILQGVLGGLTVLFYLPLAISTAHAILGQTFFLITLFLAYSYSTELTNRSNERAVQTVSEAAFVKWAWWFLALVYLQLLLGALMRHSEAGLAVPDFPTIGGSWLPLLSEQVLQNINAKRFVMNLDTVTSLQVLLHLAHRIGAVFVIVGTILLNGQARKLLVKTSKARQVANWILVCVLFQVTLGAIVIWTAKQPLITSLHVLLGASILGLSALLLMRSKAAC